MSAHPDPRVAGAERVLADAGFPDAGVTVTGHQREIAAVRVPGKALPRMLGDEGTRIAAEVRALGFRYVALDLDPAD